MMKYRPLISAMLGGAMLATCPLVDATECRPHMLGTSRTLTLERAGAAYGTAQHAALPLTAKEVVITFDDGPRPESTPAILKALKDECVRASFFMNGEPLLLHSALARAVRADGHSVGMHGYRHSHFSTLPEAEQLADLAAMQAAFEKTFGHSAPAYRFPFLEETPILTAALAKQQITVMSIDAGIEDWLPAQSPQMLADRLVERLARSGGGILLLHDAQDQTAQALPLLLSTLKSKGYQVVHLVWN